MVYYDRIKEFMPPYVRLFLYPWVNDCHSPYLICSKAALNSSGQATIASVSCLFGENLLCLYKA